MSKKRRIPFADIASQPTGISTLVFGMSWNPPEDKRETVRRLVAFLEDCRVLCTDFQMEYGPRVEKSILEMRAELTEVLKICSNDEELTGPIRAMHAACRKFLDELGHPGSPRQMLSPHEAAMWHSLGEMWTIFGLHLARLCFAYGVDVEPELASIFSRADKEVTE